MSENKIINEDCLIGLKSLSDRSVHCCVTSPPYYGLRDYGHDEQIGLEKTPEEYVSKLVEVFREVKRVLRKDGTLWLNLGDSYAGSGRGRDADGEWNPSKGGSKQETNKGAIIGRAINPKSLSKDLIKNGAIGNKWVKPPLGLKPKDLIGIPWMVAFALRADGWYLRQDIIWHKPNPMPESVTDRCTKSHEYIFLLSKSRKYYYDAEAIKTLSIEVKDYAKTHKNGNKRNPTELVNGFRPRNGEAIYELANKRSVWSIQVLGYDEAHFATFPEDLIVDMIKAGCPENGIVLDPFMGAGTTALVAAKLNRKYIGFELNYEYTRIAEKRLRDELGMFNPTCK